SEDERDGYGTSFDGDARYGMRLRSYAVSIGALVGMRPALAVTSPEAVDDGAVEQAVIWSVGVRGAHVAPRSASARLFLNHRECLPGTSHHRRRTRNSGCPFPDPKSNEANGPRRITARYAGAALLRPQARYS